MLSATFQFHKGAIGVTATPSPNDFIELFQFHKGAIGVAEAFINSLNFGVFQFHKGAIGVSYAVDSTTMCVLLFQFHKGAIGVRSYRRLPLFFQRFNSIKVRLEFIFQHFVEGNQSRFNSIKVRLESLKKVVIGVR